MTRGALIFAFNNESFDYVGMAAWAAARVQRWLDIPVTLITDAYVDNRVFDKVIVVEPEPSDPRYFADVAKKVSWHNKSRPLAFDVTPYDHTLVLDADYIVASDVLGQYWHSDLDFLCYCTAYDVAALNDYRTLNTFGKHAMPMSWATVMMFRKTKHTRQIFDVMHMVKQNWTHYKEIYGVGRSPYRNDHAMSIACSLANGHAPTWPGFHGSMANVDPAYKITALDQDSFRIDYINRESKPGYIVVKNLDLHAMNKRSLGEMIASQP
jgi:hypothetical protein